MQFRLRFHALSEGRALAVKGESIFLGIFNALARFVGLIWVLGGLLGVVNSFIASDLRAAYFFAGAFFLVAGIGLMIAKRVTPEDLERVRQRVKTSSGRAARKE